MISRTVSAEYLTGIVDARQHWRSMSAADRVAHPPAILANIVSTMRTFSPGPVKDMLKGERDFWRNQIRRATA